MRRVSFVMPSKYDKYSLPVPKDSKLEIKEVPAHSVAVHTSFGTRGRLSRLVSNDLLHRLLGRGWSSMLSLPC
jgi:SOUL heme-binding protein